VALTSRLFQAYREAQQFLDFRVFLVVPLDPSFLLDQQCQLYQEALALQLLLEVLLFLFFRVYLLVPKVLMALVDHVVLLIQAVPCLLVFLVGLCDLAILGVPYFLADPCLLVVLEFQLLHLLQVFPCLQEAQVILVFRQAHLFLQFQRHLLRHFFLVVLGLLRVPVHLLIQVDLLNLELLEDQVGRFFRESLGFLFHLLDRLPLPDPVDRPFLAFLVYPLIPVLPQDQQYPGRPFLLALPLDRLHQEIQDFHLIPVVQQGQGQTLLVLEHLVVQVVLLHLLFHVGLEDLQYQVALDLL